MTDDIKQTVKDKYGRAARRVTAGGTTGCSSASDRGECDPVTSALYTDRETAGLPEAAVKASLGCGNPTALAALANGETVLDLGSGGAATCCCRRGVSGRPARRMAST